MMFATKPKTGLPMRIALNKFQPMLPLPATDQWPEGVWDIEALSRGSMSLILFTPRGTDYQTSHEQDELYVVLKGSGVLVVENVPHAFDSGDVLFVPARKIHRFAEFTDDLVTWAIFWGPKGGEET